MAGAKVVRRLDDAPPAAVAGEGVRDVLKRVLVSPADGWEGWVMRLFEVGPGGHTPHHRHDWPHINFVVSGHGELVLGDDVLEIEAGSFAFVPAGERHQYRAAADEGLAFICIVPERGER